MTAPVESRRDATIGAWRLDGPLLWRLYDDGCVVYSARDWKLQRLEALPAAVLSLLEEQALTEDRLIGLIGEASGQVDVADAGPAVRAALHDLQQSGLVLNTTP